MVCRSCRVAELRPFLDLGTTPLANSFLREGDLLHSEPRFPLEVGFCEHCALVQLTHTVPPEQIFRDYVYMTANSPTIARHFHGLAADAARRFGLGPRDVAVEFGSNDGTLLKGFEPFGVRTLGVEPAANIARIAESKGVRTLNEFFEPGLAARVREAEGPARFVVGCNVVAHIPDINATMLAVATLLAEDGVFQMEAPYLGDLLERVEFDTIYHEHFFYLSLTALNAVFERHGLRMFDIEHVPVHGGSIRLSVCLAQASYQPTPALDDALAAERRLGLDRFETFAGFGERVAAIRDHLRALLLELRKGGSRLAAYGAAAKGNTLLNYCGIGRESLEYVADKSPLKVGLYTPGMHLPVVPADRLVHDRPGHTLLLAWNFAEEIVTEQAQYLREGGRFIVPIPEPAVLENGLRAPV
jgi:hypothetical protein